jgi:hypothetical protein
LTLPTLSASERSTYKRCRWQWSIAYQHQMKPIIAAPPLRFGTLIHSSLERYYKPGRKRGPAPAKTFAKLYEKDLREQMAMGFRDEEDVWHEAGDMGVDMLTNYIERWGDDDEWEVICTEHKFICPILSPSGKHVGNYIGVLDGVWRNLRTGKYIIVDHKTAKKIETGYLALDEQSGAYWTFGVDALIKSGVLPKGVEIEYIMFNFLRKAVKDTRPQNPIGQFLNQDGSVSKQQPADYFLRFPSYRDEADRRMMRQRTYEEVREMNYVKAGKLAVLKTPDKMHCGWCPAKDICELHETGSDWEQMFKTTFVPRYSPTREHFAFKDKEEEAVTYEHSH